MHSPSIATGTGFARLELALRAGSAEAPPGRTAAALALPTTMLAAVSVDVGSCASATTSGAAFSAASPTGSAAAASPTGSVFDEVRKASTARA